ncbi:hypothetical protein BCY91_04850 [Pelobium manganitolerans]|uniref:Uncharacterized protein n=1 Tax=Pelobium manganitolerans TaxID=1842495 RepID=A0A419S5Y6_9SPHI|nr:hypothetical protein BCY91_04850 [Pelobium manganitolerans]
MKHLKAQPFTSFIRQTGVKSIRKKKFQFPHQVNKFSLDLDNKTKPPNVGLLCLKISTIGK